MKTVTEGPRVFVFNFPAPELLEEMSVEYYQECRITGAGSVEIELRDRSTDIISATRFLPAGFTVGAVVTDDGVLQVTCTRDNAKPVVMRECSDWTAYTVRRADHEGE
ncbi:hypothetical protein ACORG1_34895 (plasmid) [Mycobacterium sp. TJFP1]